MKFDYSDQTTLNLGNQNAEHELTVFLNLGCPFCRKWYLNNKDELINNINNNSLAIHLKFWNKDKPSLMNGNTANDYVDYKHPKAALDYVDRAYAAQNMIDDLDHEDVSSFIENEMHATRHVSNEIAQENNQEALDNGLKSVPTIILDNEVVGDSNYQLPAFTK